MDPLQIIFIFIAAVVLVAAIMVVTTQNLVRAALWLILALFGIAGIFVLLEAGFLAVVQVVVYIGAIAILFIFAVMLTRKVMKDSGPQTNTSWGLAALISGAFFASSVFTIVNWSDASKTPAPLAEGIDTVTQLGVALVSPDAYVIPFEVASVLLLAALIGAIVVSWDRNQEEN